MSSVISKSTEVRRISTDRDKSYVPANPLEEQICELVARESNEEIVAVWSRDNYPKTDVHDVPLPMHHKYVVKTGKRHKDHFFSGQEFGILVSDGKITVEKLTDWFS